MPGAEKLAWALWLIFTLIMIIFANHHRTVSINYWQAGNQWLAAHPLYKDNGRGFLYLPQSAVLYAPLTIMSFVWSEAIWRLISIGFFALGLFRLTPLLVGRDEKRLPVFFLLLTVLALPLCFDCVRNGQMHLLITGLMMLATSFISQKQWSKATFLITLAFFLKPTALVFLLLILGVFTAETWAYFLLWGFFFMLLPFLTQSWSYVISQFSACLTMLKVAAVTGSLQDWAQIFNLVSQTGWEIPYSLQTIVRMIVAFIFLVVGYLIKKRQSLSSTAVWMLMLSMIYLLLFNPRTENNDYMMLIPVLGYCFINSIMNKKFYRLAFLTLVTTGIICSYYISNIFFDHRNWAAPLMGVLIFIYLGATSMNKKHGIISIFA